MQMMTDVSALALSQHRCSSFVSAIRQTVTRPRDETAEEKKARKQAVKVERQARRVDKKATKEQFSTELKHQMKGIANKETKLRKL